MRPETLKSKLQKLSSIVSKLKTGKLTTQGLVVPRCPTTTNITTAICIRGPEEEEEEGIIRGGICENYMFANCLPQHQHDGSTVSHVRNKLKSGKKYVVLDVMYLYRTNW